MTTMTESKAAEFNQQVFEAKLIKSLMTSARKAVKGWRHREVTPMLAKAHKQLWRLGYDCDTAQAIVDGCWDMAKLEAECEG